MSIFGLEIIVVYLDWGQELRLGLGISMGMSLIVSMGMSMSKTMIGFDNFVDLNIIFYFTIPLFLGFNIIFVVWFRNAVYIRTSSTPVLHMSSERCLRQNQIIHQLGLNNLQSRN